MIDLQYKDSVIDIRFLSVAAIKNAECLIVLYDNNGLQTITDFYKINITQQCVNVDNFYVIQKNQTTFFFLNIENITKECNNSMCSNKSAAIIGRILHDFMSRLHKQTPDKSVIIDTMNGVSTIDVMSIIFYTTLRSWTFDKYKTQHKQKTSMVANFIVKDVSAAERDWIIARNLSDGVLTARTLAAEPANVLNPTTFANLCTNLSEYGIIVNIIPEQELRALGMRALLAVGQGSNIPSYVVVLEWNGNHTNIVNDKYADAVALVGKGVTFDSGGISIKPSAGMDEMKTDMSGAAVVVGTLLSLAKNNIPVHVIGCIGLVENMPSGTAQRPGDIIQAMSGTTIEVLNTDAEGRMVLADLLWYITDTYKVQRVIDLATLTGAISVALGEHYAGLFSNSDDLCNTLINAGNQTSEKLWRMPMGPEYAQGIESTVADIKNTGVKGNAGATAGAEFLARFVPSGIQWAHIDIAGVSLSQAKNKPYQPGTTGFGVMLLYHFLTQQIHK